MSHESLARMIDYSHKMIAKEVKENFVARSEHNTLEFKYFMAQEEIEQLKRELKLTKETQTIQQLHSDKLPPKDVADASFQTDTLESKDESCQTENPKRKDSQVQANSQQHGEPIPTQTDSSIESGSQLQANMSHENNPIATIKEEVAMPNIPSSVGQNPSKKRKRSSVLASTIDLTMPEQPILSGSGDQQPAGDKQAATLDDGILNSEVYKIYCRNEDPKQAMKQIKELKTCLMFKEPSKPFPAKEDFKSTSEEALKKLWKIESARDSKFIQIQKYIDEGYYYDSDFYNLHHEIDGLCDCLTEIKMITPNGYEYWCVANFEKGLGMTKWYRAESFINDEAAYLAQLNVMGITKATIDNLQYMHYLKKKTTKKLWFDFAYDAVQENVFRIFSNRRYPSVHFDFLETKTDTIKTVTASLKFYAYDLTIGKRTIFKTYYGQSTRPLKRTRQQKNEKEIMEKEAKKAALVDFFKERFGFNEFNDFCVDELHRPINI